MIDSTDTSNPITRVAQAALRNPLTTYRSPVTNDPWQMASSQVTGTPNDRNTKPGQVVRPQNPLTAPVRTAQPDAATTNDATSSPVANPPTSFGEGILSGLQERTFTRANPLTTVAPGNVFTERDSAMNSANPLTTIDMNANNASMARANAIRQSTGDATGPKVVMLGDSGRAESQALMDKWGREDAAKEMMAEMGRNPKAANALASLHHSQQGTETALAGVENQRQIAATNDATQRRGQDIAAQTHAAQLAGNPQANALTQARITEANASTDQIRQHIANVIRLNNESDPERRQSLIENILAAQGKNVVDSGRLTLPMQRVNAEIDRARDLVAGLLPDEIKRKTAKTTDTGRENPEFDATLERAVTLANRRKVGNDQWFDEKQSGKSNANVPSSDGTDVTARFKADTAMQGHTLGKQTDLGIEVLDGSGKLIGHYR